jgi:lipoyl(octanoyl) transferase
MAIQSEVVERRKKKEIQDCLLFVEYPHLITLGRSGSIQHLLASQSVLEEHGVGFFVTDRGGDITYHGPGQLIAYPVIDLKEWRRDIGYYLRSLEDCLIATLADFGIPARSISGNDRSMGKGRKDRGHYVGPASGSPPTVCHSTYFQICPFSISSFPVG